MVLVLNMCGENGANLPGGWHRSHVMFFKRGIHPAEQLLAEQLLDAEQILVKQLLAEQFLGRRTTSRRRLDTYAEHLVRMSV